MSHSNKPSATRPNSGDDERSAQIEQLFTAFSECDVPGELIEQVMETVRLESLLNIQAYLEELYLKTSLLVGDDKDASSYRSKMESLYDFVSDAVNWLEEAGHNAIDFDDFFDRFTATIQIKTHRSRPRTQLQLMKALDLYPDLRLLLEQSVEKAMYSLTQTVKLIESRKQPRHRVLTVVTLLREIQAAIKADRYLVAASQLDKLESTIAEVLKYELTGLGRKNLEMLQNTLVANLKAIADLSFVPPPDCIAI